MSNMLAKIIIAENTIPISLVNVSMPSEIDILKIESLLYVSLIYMFMNEYAKIVDKYASTIIFE